MNYIGGVQNLTFNPIQQYNQMLKSSNAMQVQNANPAFTESVTPFDKVLNEQTSALNQEQPQMKMIGGVAMDYVDGLSNIQNAQEAQNAESIQNTKEKEGSTGMMMNDFTKSLTSGLDSVNDLQDSANKAQEAFAAGEDVSIHDVMIASEKAQMGLQMAIQLRNKLITAYSEINNIKV